MAQFGRFNISNTGRSKQGEREYEACVRIYFEGNYISSLYVSTYSPLSYIRKYPNGGYGKALMAVLRKCGATQGEIDIILNGERDGHR